MQTADDRFPFSLRASRPAVPPGFVRRERLDDLLTAGVVGPVTVVSAGPGFGKTLTVAAWTQLRSKPVAWLVADETDDLPSFWTHLLGALVAAALPEDSPLRAVVPGTQFGMPEVGRIAAGIDRLAEPVVLVVDDFHRIVDPAILDSLVFLLDRNSRGLRLILVSRTEPNLRGLRRLLLSADLTEIHADALAFTEAETSEFCTRGGLELGADQIAMLQARTEGWPAGLRLALLSIDQNDVHSALQRFSGQNRLVAAYLIEELLETLAPTDRRFLLATSIVEQVTGDLARTLTGRADSHQALERLVAHNALTVRLSDRPDWFSYHPLLRQLLCDRLAAEQPDSVPDLNQRAAAWFAEHGDPVTAIRHLAAAQDWSGVTRLLGAVAIPLIVTPQATALSAALAPAHAEAAHHPTRDTLLVAAVVEYKRRNFYAMRRNVDDAALLTPAAGEADRPADVLMALTRMVYARVHNPAGLIDRAEQVLEVIRSTPRGLLPAADAVAVIATMNRAVGLVHAGVLDHAEATLRQVRARAHNAGLILTELAATSHLAVVDVLLGRLPEARTRAAAVAELADQRGWTREPQVLAAYAAAVLTHLECNDLDRADEWIEFAVAAGTPGSDVGGLIMLEIAAVMLAVARGDAFAAAAAEARLRVASEGSGRLPDLLARWCDVALAHAALAAGRPEAVLSTIKDPGEEAGFAAALERIVLAKAHFGTAQPATAAAALGPPIRFVPFRVLAVEAAVLGAVAATELRRDAGALERITAAVELAQPIGAVRPFATGGPRVATLLERYRQVVGAHSAFTRELLTACGAPQSSVAAEPVAVDQLTERELVVLRYLPTMLKTSEIASDLFVSVNTVKTHQQSIYRKLGVSTRRDAVDRARDLDLMP